MLRGVLDGEVRWPFCFVEANAADEIHTLLATAEKLTPVVVVLSTEALTDRDLQNAIDRLEQLNAEPTDIARARKCKQHIGHLASVTVDLFVSQRNLVLRCVQTPDWYDTLFTTPDSGVTSSEWQAAYRDREEERKRWTPEKMREAGRKAAVDSRFPQCKTEQARLYLLRAVLGSDIPQQDHLLKQIAREAKVIYDFEVKAKASN